MALSEMTISASWQDAGPLSLRASRGRGRRQAFAAARRHSRRVRWLRFLLPLLGLSAIGVFFVLTQISLPGDIDLGVARLSVTRNSIIMDSPRLTGFDRDGREYSLSADRAVQALASPDQVRLESIDARLAAAGHGAATIKAEAGDYDHGKSTLILHGDIVIDSAEGYALRMRDAHIDFKAGTLTSPNPVSVGYAGSEIVGQRFGVSQGGKVLLFEGGVRTILMPPKRTETPAPPDAG
jgi:lipopolysaccharide export system protein LptC